MTLQRNEGKSGFSLIEMMVVVTLIGILSTIAMPILVRQLRKSKTVEAYEALSKLRVGAKTYYMFTHWSPSGNILPHSFPTGIKMVPNHGPKCDRVETPTAVWDANGWHDLHFSFTEYHYFAYAFSTSGATGTNARYTAFAYGDLDCDSKYSTFELRGQVNNEGDVATLGPMITAELE